MDSLIHDLAQARDTDSTLTTLLARLQTSPEENLRIPRHEALSLHVLHMDRHLRHLWDLACGLRLSGLEGMFLQL